MMQWIALWQMARALLPQAFMAATKHPIDEAERQRQRELFAQKLEEYSRVALQIAFRVAQLLVGLTFLFATATIVYSLLYYMVIPSRLHEQDIFFDYGTHAALSMPRAHHHHQHQEQHALPLTLPTARLNLLDTEHQWTASPHMELPPLADRVLVPGVKYDVLIELTMAESRVNKDIGMFMVQTTLGSHAEDGGVLASSSRAAIVKDSHALVEWTRVASWLLPYAFRMSDPAQTLIIPAVNGFRESKSFPLTSVEIQLNHPMLQVYSAKLTIIAQLAGVRYLMYHWSVPTALLVILNLVFLEALALLIVYALYQLPTEGTGEDGDGGTTLLGEGDEDEDEEEDENAKADRLFKHELDKGELFEQHRSGGIPSVHVERAIKQEPRFGESGDAMGSESGSGGVTTSSLLADEMEWKLRYRGSLDAEDQ